MLLIYAFIFVFLFDAVSIEGYYKFFFFFKYLFLITSCLRITFNLIGSKHFADITKLIETVFITNLILIAVSDPHFNTESIPNLVTFHEIYFRYLEVHILIFSFYFLYNDENIESEISKTIYSFSSIIGRYDSFRYFTLLNISHYLFIFINGLSFSLSYWIGFSSIFINFYSIISYRQRNIKNCYIATILLIIWNLASYSYALIKTAPNIGNLKVIEEVN